MGRPCWAVGHDELLLQLIALDHRRVAAAGEHQSAVGAQLEGALHVENHLSSAWPSRDESFLRACDSRAKRNGPNPQGTVRAPHPIRDAAARQPRDRLL